MTGKLNLVLTAVLVASALSLVNARYQARHLFIDLERYQQQARQLDIDWRSCSWISPASAKMSASNRSRARTWK